MRHLINKVLR